MKQKSEKQNSKKDDERPKYKEPHSPASLLLIVFIVAIITYYTWKKFL